MSITQKGVGSKEFEIQVTKNIANHYIGEAQLLRRLYEKAQKDNENLKEIINTIVDRKCGGSAIL